MSNLSDLLPAGAGAKSATFTASGTLSSGQTVVLQSDGTVKAISDSASAQVVGSTTAFDTNQTDNAAITYDSTNEKVVVVYRDTSNSNYPTAVVGTVSGDTISFGTAVVIQSTGSYYCCATFDSGNDKVVVSYKNSSYFGHGMAAVGTVSGTSISFGTAVNYVNTGGQAPTEYINLTYDSANGKIVICYQDFANSYYGTAIVGTVSGTSISFGTEVVFNSGNSLYSNIAYDASNEKVVICYRDSGNSGYGTAIVGTVSGTSISFGTEVVFQSQTSVEPGIAYDSTAQKIVIAYSAFFGGYTPYAIVGTVSGTSISFGTATTFDSGQTDDHTVTYDPNTDSIVIAYRDIANSGYGTFSVGKVSGTSISFTSPTVFDSSGDIGSSQENRVWTTYDSANKRVVAVYVEPNDGSAQPFDGLAFTIKPVGSNSADFVGITDEAIADTATGSVVVEGGVTEKARGPYYISNVGADAIFEAASSNRMSSVYDLSNQKIVITYTDVGNSNYGTAVVGTVSGTSISFGTPVIFEAAATYSKAAVYDPDTGKIVIAYSDAGNSQYGTAIVGTVSGTSISFGTAVVFNSAATVLANNGSGAVYDTTNDKVVIAYVDGGNSSYGTSIVGTVSGTSISFGSETVFNTGVTIDASVAFDSDNSKIIISYRDSTNSSYGTAVVGTVSGTSISFGSEVVFNSATTLGMTTVYDTNANKVLVAYGDAGNSTYGTAVVGTVSGTSISFGSPSVYAEYYSSAQFAVFDSAANQTIICTGGTTGTLNALAASISGTSVSFSDSTLVSGTTSTYGNLAYDSTNSKAIITYTDSTNSSYGTANVLTTSNELTTGSTYYVQDDGSLSTTSSSVTAGKALSSTTLLLKG